MCHVVFVTLLKATIDPLISGGRCSHAKTEYFFPGGWSKRCGRLFPTQGPNNPLA